MGSDGLETTAPAGLGGDETGARGRVGAQGFGQRHRSAQGRQATTDRQGREVGQPMRPGLWADEPGVVRPMFRRPGYFDTDVRCRPRYPITASAGSTSSLN